MIRDFTQLLENEYVRRFYDTWQELCIGDDLPARKAVRLQDFAPFAPDLLIYQMIAPGHLHCRLMGSHVSDRVKIYSPDVNWLDLVAPDMREAGSIWWGNLFSTPCAGVMQFSTGFINGTSRASQALLLPVRQGPDEIQLIGLSNASGVYAAEEARDQLIISHDCFQTKYIDVGFGLPAGVPEREDHKVLSDEIWNIIFEE